MSNERIIDLYRHRARRYDLTANLYYLLGYREWKYRYETIDALSLNSGDTVVDIGCGTGLNFTRYQEAIGPQGMIIGVDLTDAMLGQAQRRVDEYNWRNVTLIRKDVLAYEFPAKTDAVISTYALSLVPNCERVLEKVASSLQSGGRVALLDLQIPEEWPAWLTALSMSLMKPFAVTSDWKRRQPWRAIKQVMREHFMEIVYAEYYLGLTYAMVAEKSH